MRGMTWAIVGVTILAAAAATAADDKDAAAIVDRVLTAAGGTEKLAQPRAYSFKQELTVRSKKAPASVTTHSTFYFQPPKKFRMEEEGERGGKTIKYVEVINGNRGWGKRDGTPVPLSPQAIKDPMETQQNFGYKFILLLRDPKNKITTLGESTSGDRTLVGLKVVRPIARASDERRLFFDSKTMLLARSESHTKLSTGSELVGTEQTWEDYQTIDGIAVPRKVTHAVKDTVFERTYSDFKFADQLDSKLFDAP
jgi:hypothetical protein